MPKHCEACSSEFIDDYAFHGHLLGKKHLRNVERANIRKRLQENSVFITGLRQQTSQKELLDFFGQYGHIVHYKYGLKYLIVEYDNSATAKMLLSQPIFMGKWRFNIRPRIIEKPIQKNDELKNGSDKSTSKEMENGLLDPKVLETELENEITFVDQYRKFLSLIQDDEVPKNGIKICETLNHYLKATFPKGSALRFGSSITGIHLKSSDVDVFFDVGETHINEDENSVTYHNSYGQLLTQNLIFREVKNVLYKNRSTFSRVIPIPVAKTPVIKFHHNPTATNCDISFKNNLAVHNSQLLKHYLTMDERVKPLMIIIKYWGKCLGITGSGKISNYSLAMLIIFYLQQPNINLLPTVKELQSSCEPIYSCGWLVSFNKDFQSTSENTSTVPELLRGFFKFYAKFDFNLLVISPLEGVAYKNTDFTEIKAEICENVESLNLDKCACIQDPFQRDYNIASTWTERLVTSFQHQCTTAVKICDAAEENNYQKLLSTLCDPRLRKRILKSKVHQFAIDVGKFGTFGLPADFDKDLDEQSKKQIISDNWFDIVSKLVEKIMKDIFKFQVHSMPDGPNKQKKIEEESDVHTKERNRVIFNCEGKYFMHQCRKHRISSLDPSLSCIDREALISDQVLEDLKNKSEEETSIQLTCELEKTLTHVLIRFSDKNCTEKIFNGFATYMMAKIPSFIGKELQHMVQYKKKL